MVIGSLGYVVNDALIRAATDEGLDVFQALCIRGFTMATFFAALARLRDERLRRSHLQSPLIWRVAAELLASSLFFAGLIHLDFANAQVILMVAPFLVTLAAAVLLGERVTARQYGAIAVGFIGVLAVVQPGADGFSAWSLVVLLSTIFLVLREFATRQVAASTPTIPIAMLTAFSLGTLTGMISLFTGWGKITGMALVYLALACCSLVIGYLFTIQTVRVGDLSVSAPFRYTTLLGAVVIGTFIFGESLGSIAVAGCTLIVVAGLYSIHLEGRGSSISPGLLRSPLTATGPRGPSGRRGGRRP